MAYIVEYRMTDRESASRCISTATGKPRQDSQEQRSLLTVNVPSWLASPAADISPSTGRECPHAARLKMQRHAKGNELPDHTMSCLYAKSLPVDTLQ